MSTFTGLNTMVRGIYQNQMSLNTTGHNITNAATEGYSRQNTNPVATMAEYRTGLYGNVAVGTGVDVQSVTRARDIYADVQYRNETATQQYYEKMAVNYDKLETILNDTTDSGIYDAMLKFHESWTNLSARSSDNEEREDTVVTTGKILASTMKTATESLQTQINNTYDDMRIYVDKVNELMENIVNANKKIVAAESSGAFANDLRDQRDLLVDDLAQYINLSVNEDEYGNYKINSGGTTLVNGQHRLHLEMSNPVDSKLYGTDYGISDYSINIKESHTVFSPQNGILKAEADAIETCKKYIDDMADLASFMMTVFNEQHKAGYDLNGNDGINFFGETSKTYKYGYDAKMGYSYVAVYDNDSDFDPTSGVSSTAEEKAYSAVRISGVALINALTVNTQFNEAGGERYVAAASRYYTYKSTDTSTSSTTITDAMKYDSDTTLDDLLEGADFNWDKRTGDGVNATYISELFNMTYDKVLDQGAANVAVWNKYLIKNEDGEVTAQNVLNGNGIEIFYRMSVTTLASDAASTDTVIEQQDGVMEQLQNMRDATAGVDWNEELSNMIMYQKGYIACSRMLNAMDECLDRLVNSTGMVGR